MSHNNEPSSASEHPEGLRRQIESVRSPWVSSSYYADAERWTHLFWDADRFFRPMFDQLPRGTVIDLACGHGRHAERSAPLVERLILVDVIEENLATCRTRLARFSNVEFRLGSGASFAGCGDASVDAIYCYDAMVHFAPDVVRAYLTDTARVLRKGGRALYHHSNYEAGEGKVWSKNPHARNWMSARLFADFAQAVGLTVLEQRVIPWGNTQDLDAITLLELGV